MTKPLFHTRSSLMSRLGVEFLTWRRYLQRRIAPYNITLKQLHVLSQLDQADYLYPSDIAEMLFCDRPTATVIIDNLEKQAWIQRERDPLNRKFTRISLTHSGRDKLAELEAVSWGIVDPLAEFSEDEIRQFDALLNKLNQSLDPIRELPLKED